MQARIMTACAALLAATVIAKADSVTVTITGHVAPTTLIDTAGVFGTPGDNLAGDPFTSIWSYDAFCSASGCQQSFEVGITATLTINGGTVAYGLPGNTEIVALQHTINA